MKKWMALPLAVLVPIGALNLVWNPPASPAVEVPVPHKKPTKLLFGDGMPRVVRPRVGVDVLGARVQLHECKDEECDHPTAKDYLLWWSIWLEEGQAGLDAEYASWEED